MKSKLKFSNDYRDKIVHNKFKNKLHNKIERKKFKCIRIKGGKKYKKYADFSKNKFDNIKENSIGKKKNYLDNLYTRSKENINIVNDINGIISKTGEKTSKYLSYGSDENTGVESAEKTINASSKLNKYSNKRRLKKLNKKCKLQEYKPKLESKKVKTEVNRIKKFQKFQKKKQIKSYIINKNKNIKQSVYNTLKIIREILLKKVKCYALVIIVIIIIGTFIINFASSSIIGLINSVSGVITTTYLSDENILNEVNNYFLNMEEILQNEIDSVKERFPNYDEYILKSNGEIGHNTHELLSYITSRCGEVKNFSQVKGIIDELFKKMYSISYREEIEIKYRDVTETHIDENGNEYIQTYKVAYEYKKLITALDKKDMDMVIREIFKDHPNNLTHYEVLLETQGNMSDIFGSNDLSEIVKNPNFNKSNIEFTEEQAKLLFSEAEKHIGKRYVFRANGPTNFDCSSFVCWSFTHSSIKNMPRTTAWGIYKNYCEPISPSEAKAGDIIFFKNTYNSNNPISHVGIYAGNGMMLHAGDPIQYTSINTSYWKSHFYGFGRIK